MTVVINGDTGIDKVSSGAETPQCKFPATQSPSSDPNTLDDYEEGTFTATLIGTTTNPTNPVTATGKYTKVGRLVHFTINFSNFDSSGASGVIRVTGLPFSSADWCVCGVMSYNAITFSGILTSFVLATTAYFYGVSSAAAWAEATHNAGTARYLFVSGNYMV